MKRASRRPVDRRWRLASEDEVSPLIIHRRDRGRREERDRIRMRRPRDYLVGSAFFHNSAQIHYGDAI